MAVESFLVQLLGLDFGESGEVVVAAGELHSFKSGDRVNFDNGSSHAVKLLGLAANVVGATVFPLRDEVEVVVFVHQLGSFPVVHNVPGPL